MKNPSIGIIVNAHAKRIRTGVIPLDKMRRISDGIADFRITGTFEELEAALRDFKASAIPYVGILGGDGTLHHVLSRMEQIYGSQPLPALVLFRAGTMNNVARSIGLKGNALPILRRLVKAIHEGHPVTIKERDTMRIGDLLCFIFGLGFVTRFAQEAYAGNEKGALQNVKILFKSISHAIKPPLHGSLYEGITAEVSVDGVLVPFHNISAIIAGTVEGIGLGFYPMSRGNERSRSFHSLVTGVGPRQIIARIPQLKRGRYRPHPLLRDTLAAALDIVSAAPFTYTLDGDMYDSAGELHVGLGPRIAFVHI